MKIAYVTTYDASDVHGWSGLGFHLANALKKERAEMDFIGNLNIRHDRLTRIKKLFYSKALGQRYQYQREPWVAEGYADQIESRLDPSIDCIVSPGSIPIARIRSKIPTVIYTDATFAGMVGFYDDFSNLCAETIRNGHRLEQEALSSCSLAVYSSDWAAKTAIENYSVDPRKVRVIPFGANVDSNRTREDVKMMIRSRPKDVCRLLFIGVDWQRKGGPLALEIADRLNKAGLKTELHIAGLRQPPVDPLPDFVIDHGFISKSTPEGRTKLDQLIAGSHFMVLMSKAEAYGLVLCEANSFGVPDIASNVGGIPTIIRDEINGKVFPPEASAPDIALYIANLFSDYDRYEDLALTSFGEYQQRLNWNISGQRLMNILREL